MYRPLPKKSSTKSTQLRNSVLCLGQHVGTALTCCPGLSRAPFWHLALKDCLSLVCSVSGQCHPPSLPPTKQGCSICLLQWLLGGGGISHPPRPSSPSLHQQNRKASPSSLSSFCPPLHPLLEKGSLVHQLCGWRHIVPCALGGSSVFVSRIVSARHHRRSFMFWGPWSKPRCRPWFLPRTRRPCAA